MRRFGRARGLAGLAMAVTLGGCVAARPIPTTPPLPEPPEAWNAGEGAGPIEPGPWWSAFRDPTLDRLLLEALAENPGLARSAARVEAAAALARAAGADRRPSVRATGDAGRQRQNFIGLPIPGAEGEVLSTTTSTAGVGVNVSWELDLWGRLGAVRDAADAEAEAAAFDLEAARLSLTGQVAKAWYALVEAAAQVKLGEGTVTNRADLARRIARRYEGGLRGPLDLRLARAEELSSRADLAARRRALDLAARRLDVLLGRYPAATLTADAREAHLPEPPPVPGSGLPGELLARRPDLLAAERRVDATGFDLAAARAALYPRFALSASAGRRGVDFGDLARSDFDVWSLFGSLVQPLFEGGRLRAAEQASVARVEEAAAGWVQSTLAAWLEVEASLVAERHLEDAETALSGAAHEAAAAARLARDRYAAGLGDYLTVLEAERQATAAASRRLATTRDRLLARVDLHLALGGALDPPDLPQPDPGDAR